MNSRRKKKIWEQVKKIMYMEIWERDRVPPINKGGKDGCRKREKLVKGTRKAREESEAKKEEKGREVGENYKEMKGEKGGEGGGKYGQK